MTKRKRFFSLSNDVFPTVKKLALHGHSCSNLRSKIVYLMVSESHLDFRIGAKFVSVIGVGM